MNVRFRLDNKVYEDDLQYIMLDATFDNKRLRLSTGEKIQARNWDQNRKRVKKTMKGSAEINLRIDELEDRVRRIYREMRLRHQTPTTQLIREELQRNQTQNGSFFDYFEEFIQSAKSKRRPNTIENYRTTVNYLKKFQETTKHTLSLETMDSTFYDKFVAYAFGLGLGAKTNTVGNKIKTITAFLNWCVGRGIEVNPEFKKFKRLSEDSVQVALTMEELELIHEAEITTDDRLSGIRDIFLLLCYTGLRYSDVVKLRPVNLKDDMLIVNTVKTSDNLKLPLMPQAREILKRCPANGFAAPVNKQANKLIRQLCELAGIDEPTLMVEHRGPTRIERVVPKYDLITTHTGRRTFVTLSLEKGVRPEVLMRITGHKDMRTMKKYIKLTEKVTKSEFLRAWGTRK